MSISNPAVVPNDMLTLADYYQRVDQTGAVREIAEILNESNEVIQDIKYKEGNTTTGDQQTVRVGLPEVYWRQFNRGVPSSKSQVATIQETCGMIEARATCDADLIAMNGDGIGGQIRLQEDKAFIESIGQKETYTIFKGDYKKASEGFSGFETRYSTCNKSKAENAKNVIDAGGTGSNLTSIYLIGWGDNIYCPYPKGSKIGLQKKDYGTQLIKDEFGNEFEAYTTIYKKQVGLMVRDWRYCVRIANIDIEALRGNTGIGNPDLKTQGWNLITIMQDALDLLPADYKAQPKFYMNRDVFSGLTSLNLRCNTNVIEWEKSVDHFGKGTSWRSFNGIPLRRVDQLTNDEKRVV